MIITRTPNRISFLGGGTDYPEYYNRKGGLVIGIAINKYSYLSARYKPPFLGYKTHLSYSEVEKVNDHKDISHNVIREALKLTNINDGVCIHHDSDLPSSSGMGSSASFTVGLLHSLFALKKEMKNKEELAQQSRYLERDILGDVVGIQDNLFAAHGGFRRIDFSSVAIKNNILYFSSQFIDELQSNIFLVSSGIYRRSSDIAKTYNQSDERCDRIKEIAEDGYSKLCAENLHEFGALVREAWYEKKGMSDKVSNKTIDDIEDAAISGGAYGFKLLGSGGGGFCLIMCPSHRKQYIKDSLSGLVCVDVKIDWTGTTILHMDNKYE